MNRYLRILINSLVVFALLFPVGGLAVSNQQTEGDHTIYLPFINLADQTINQPPNTPSTPTPADHSTGQSLEVDLSWTGGDPDGDPLTYDIYFEAGDDTPDVLVSENQTGTTYTPVGLEGETHYYWQINATDDRGSTTNGPVWDFTTGSKVLVDIWQEMGVNSASGGGISEDDHDSRSPSIAMAPDGTPYIAWYDAGSENDEIFVRRWNGSAWEEVGAGSASAGGISNNSGSGHSPSIAIDSNGTPYIAWDDNSSGDYEIYVRQWNGSAWVEVGSNSASAGGISNNSGNSFSPSIAIGADDHPYVTWNDDTSGNHEIYARHWNGSTWETVGTGSATGGGISSNSGTSSRASIAVDASGVPYIAWYDNSTGDYEVYVRRWDGANWVEVGVVSAAGGGISNNGGYSAAPSIAIDPDGIPYITWHDFNDTTGHYEIYARQWSGSAWVEIVASSASGDGISHTTDKATYPSIAITPDGTPYITWQDENTTGEQIYIRRFNGSAWEEAGAGSANGAGISDTEGVSEHPAIAITPTGSPIVTWQDNTNGNYEIYVLQDVRN